MKWTGSTIFLLLLGWLAACTNVPALSINTGPTAAPVQPAKTLNIYSQEPAIDPATLANFESRFGAKINYATAAEAESGLADMKAGLADYDLVILSDRQVGSLRAEGLFAPLNKGNIPNFKNIDPAFLNPLYDPGNRYCVPFQWGMWSLSYNREGTGKDIQGWADFFKTNRLRRLGLPDDHRLALGATLLYLGYSPNTTNDLEIGAASELWRNHGGPIVIYAPAQGPNLLADGQVDLLFTRTASVLALMNTHPTLRYVIPEEGSLLWLDVMCLLADAPHPALAETFINYLLEPETGAALAHATHTSTPNQAALPLLNSADRADPALYPDDKLRQRLFTLVNIDPATADLYEQAWAESVVSRNSQAAPGSN
ncbi:MAG: spermidine/putrescine ABC transporter substrate-binding protein [Anaerolineales bacterium]|nr:spermidine/putrescine ABC transporter substrate-binding protein [Anaerolineales bacterium]